MSKQQPASKQKPAPAAPPAKTPAPAPAPAAPPAGAEEKKPEKKEKPKAPKRRIQVWKLYKLEGDKVTRLRRECPRGGGGYLTGEHKKKVPPRHVAHTMYTKTVTD